MAQTLGLVTPRPVTQGGLSRDRLPEIPHPLSRMETVSNLDIRGVSRAGDRPNTNPGFGRPLPSEGQVRKSGRRSSRSRSSIVARSLPEPGTRYEDIPEGVEVMFGDPHKTRLPIFGKLKIFNLF